MSHSTPLGWWVSAGFANVSVVLERAHAVEVHGVIGRRFAHAIVCPVFFPATFAVFSARVAVSAQLHLVAGTEETRRARVAAGAIVCAGATGAGSAAKAAGARTCPGVVAFVFVVHVPRGLLHVQLAARFAATAFPGNILRLFEDALRRRLGPACRIRKIQSEILDSPTLR